MFNRTAKVSKVTWKTILVNPLIFWTMAAPSDGDSVFLLISTGVVLTASSLMPLYIPRTPLSVSAACYIIFALGCGMGGLGLANILEGNFPNFPTVNQWEWVQWMPSAFENVAILVWIFVVLNIAPITRQLFISAVLVAAAAGYALTSDVFAIRDALVFGVTREIADWEQTVEFLLNGCALTVWAHFIMKKLASTSIERFTGRCTLLIGVTFILVGIFGILWDIFS